MERYFKLKNNMLYSEIMSNEADRMLFWKGLNTSNVFEKDFSKAQKLEDYDDFAATRRTSATSDMLLKK